MRSHPIGFINGLQELLLGEVETPSSLNMYVLLADQLNICREFSECSDQLGFLPFCSLLVQTYPIVVLLNSLEFLVVQLAVLLDVLFGNANFFSQGSNLCVQLSLLVLKLTAFTFRSLGIFLGSGQLLCETFQFLVECTRLVTQLLALVGELGDFSNPFLAFL